LASLPEARHNGTVSADYLPLEQSPTREEVDRAPGLVLLEFGTNWCGICRAAAPRVASQLQQHPQVRHVKVEDGPGRPLGRSFRVKLWPSLVFLKDGTVVRQLARPSDAELREAFAALTGSA
jgi:thioredoxin